MSQEEKRALREQYLAIRRAMPIDDIESKSEAIMARLVSLPQFENASVIFTYISMPSEVITYELIRFCWQRGKEVAVPITIPGKTDMYFVLFDDFQTLNKTSFGVMQPQKGQIVEPGEGAPIIVPGVVFGHNKYRIGYGRGFYDFYLGVHPGTYNIGLSFSEQLVDYVHFEAHDIPMHHIITENGIL